MTEREKLRTFGVYYLGIARNYDKAIETYEELVAKFPSDSAGYNNLAIAHFNLLNFAKALDYGRKAIEIYPKTYKYRGNYALYAMYAGDFQTAASTAQALIDLHASKGDGRGRADLRAAMHRLPDARRRPGQLTFIAAGIDGADD